MAEGRVFCCLVGFALLSCVCSVVAVDNNNVKSVNAQSHAEDRLVWVRDAQGAPTKNVTTVHPTKNITTAQPIKNVTTFHPTLATTAVPQNCSNETTPAYVGFISAGVAVFFFGTNFVPVKKFETGDGMFFQWLLCAAIWLTGLVVHAIRGFPTFYPWAMLGGFLWATGNVTVVPILKTIGLSMGILIWGTFNLLSGWASSRFGWFGLIPTVLQNPVLNDIGVGFAVLSAFIYMFVKTEVSSANDSKVENHKEQSEQEKLLPENINTSDTEIHVAPSDETFIDRLTPMKKRIIGILLSVGAGILYGLNFTPVILIQQHTPNASQNALDYVFSHFCGIFLTSSFYFIVYCMIKRNSPAVFPKVILPAFASGIMWAIADACWFIANQALSESVSFPIITTGPGIVASIWGVLVFKEIRGKKNLLILLLAFAITITGTILTAFSMKNNDC